MASGHKHRRAAALIAAPCAIWAGAITKDWLVGAGAGAGCLLGIVIHPDLDLLEAVTPWYVKVLSVALWTIIWYGFALAVML